MKTKKELDVLKSEINDLNQELTELTEDELQEVLGGSDFNKTFSKTINLTNAEITGNTVNVNEVLT